MSNPKATLPNWFPRPTTWPLKEDLLSAAQRLLDYFNNPDDHPEHTKDDVLNRLREVVELMTEKEEA